MRLLGGKNSVSYVMWQAASFSNNGIRLLGGKNSVSFDMWQAASFSNNGLKISSKMQNEMWMGTGRRSIWDDYIFRKHSQKSPGKSLKFGRKPWKRI